MIKMDMSIPGWMSEPALRIIAEHCKRLNRGDSVLELGAYLGRTSATIAHNCTYGVGIHVVDLWVSQTQEEIKQLREYNERMLTTSDQFYEIDRLMAKYTPPRFDAEDFYKLWQYNTRSWSNIKHYRDNTQTINTEQFPDFELIIMDASHDYIGTTDELCKWWTKLKPGGTLIIDDYATWDGVQGAVNDFFHSTEHGSLTKTPYNIALVVK